MIKITISKDEDLESVERVAEAVEREIKLDPHFAGAAYSIERGDRTSISGGGDLDSAILMHNVIIPALRGR